MCSSFNPVRRLRKFKQLDIQSQAVVYEYNQAIERNDGDLVQRIFDANRDLKRFFTLAEKGLLS